MVNKLKVNDIVIIKSRHYPDSLARIVGETKNYWVVGKNKIKYRKDNLNLSGGDIWGGNYIFKGTQEDSIKIETERKKRVLTLWNWNEETPEIIDRVYEIVKQINE